MLIVLSLSLQQKIKQIKRTFCYCQYINSKQNILLCMFVLKITSCLPLQMAIASFSICATSPLTKNKNNGQHLCTTTCHISMENNSKYKEINAYDSWKIYLMMLMIISSTSCKSEYLDLLVENIAASYAQRRASHSRMYKCVLYSNAHCCNSLSNRPQKANIIDWRIKFKIRVEFVFGIHSK